MTASSTKPESLSVLDRPNSYIGKTVPRPNLDRLMQGRGQYVSDMVLPRMAHVVFLRSPHAHARIISLDAHAAKQMPGVIAIVTGKELAAVITPWVGVLSHLKGLKSAPQHAIAIDRVCWQGEAVAAVVATTRALAEDAAEAVVVAYEELEAATEMRTALDPQTPVIHLQLGDNLAFERIHEAGAVDQAFADADEVVEADFIFGRHTGVTLEPRAVVADWSSAEERLTIYQGSQAPHMVQNIAALHHMRRLAALIDREPFFSRAPVGHDRARLERYAGVPAEDEICFHHLVRVGESLIDSSGLVDALEG